jgi:glycosyltransferase involved in cell wall biosynthesis
VDAVLFLIKGLGRGGAEQLLAASAPYLDRSSFRYVVAYLLPHKDALVGTVREAGVEVRCLREQARTGWVRPLKDLVRDREVRIVHSHSPRPASRVRVALSVVRHVYTEHNVWGRYHPATYWANRLTFPRNDHAFAVSEEVRRSMRPRAGSAPSVETLHHGLDPEARATWGSPDGVRDELGIPVGVPLVGTVGNLTAKKAHAMFLEAVGLARRTIPSLRAVVVGRGPLESVLRRRAGELGLQDAVIFAGYREDAPRVASAFDVFVLSSRHEGLPVSLLEAMSTERPVVATSVGGVPEVVRDGREGILVPPGDAAALAAGIARLVGDGELRRRLGSAAGARAAAFDIRRAVRRQEEVYRSLLAVAPTRRGVTG